MANYWIKFVTPIPTQQFSFVLIYFNENLHKVSIHVYNLWMLFKIAVFIIKIMRISITSVKFKVIKWQNYIIYNT